MKERQVFKGKNVNFVTVEGKLGSAPLSIVALLKINNKIYRWRNWVLFSEKNVYYLTAGALLRRLETIVPA